MGEVAYSLSLIIMVTCLIPAYIGTVGSNAEAVGPNDDSEDSRGYRITGIIVPHNATMNTCCQSSPPLFNRTTGEFIFEGLKDGEYILAFSATGYEAFVQTILIDGSDVNLGIIFLKSESGSELSSYQVKVGPWVDQRGNGIPGINVSFDLGTDRYWGLTDEKGIASIGIPIHSIPNGTEMSFTLRSGRFHWKWNQETPPYKAYGKHDDRAEKSSVLIYSIFVVLIITFFFLLWSVTQIIRRRKT